MEQAESMLQKLSTERQVDGESLANQSSIQSLLHVLIRGSSSPAKNPAAVPVPDCLMLGSAASNGLLRPSDICV